MDVNSPGLKNCVVMKDVACIFPMMSPASWGAGDGRGGNGFKDKGARNR